MLAQRSRSWCLLHYLPVQQGLLDKHIHGVEQQVWIGAVRSERVDHDALDQTRLPQRLHQIDKLPRQPEGHELRHGKELGTQRYVSVPGEAAVHVLHRFWPTCVAEPNA